MCFCSHLNPKSMFVMDSVLGLLMLRFNIKRIMSKIQLTRKLPLLVPFLFAFLNSSFQTWHMVGVVWLEIDEASIGKGLEYGVILEVANSCTVNIIGQIPTVLEKVLLFFFFLMALLITQDEYLVPLNNRQYCMSVLRGKGQTISLLVYTK